jgi:lipid-A-disaccharide synthase
MPTVMVSCGEASGDLYAGALTRALQRIDPAVGVFGFGGDRLRAAGATLVGDYRGLAVTGLTEAVRVLPRSYAMYRQLVTHARHQRPDVFVAIDFPDFNFRLAGAMRRLGVPVVYYISPQLWAWRPGRLRTMARLASKVLVIFPFEVELYERAGIPVEFVGHPLIDLIEVTEHRERFLRSLGLESSAPTVALLPGSRPNEVRTILPVLAEAASAIRTRVPDVQFVVARAPGLDEHLFDVFGAAAGSGRVVQGRTDDVLNASDLVLTASGTATVQAALHEKPMVIVYRLSSLTYRVGRPFVKVDTFGMVNLIAGRRVVPELIQDDFTASGVADTAVPLLTDLRRGAAMREELRAVRQKLGVPGASDRAAAAVLAAARAGAPGTGSNGDCNETL